MYVKIYYKEQNNSIKSLRAVDYNNKALVLNFKNIIGSPITEGTKRIITSQNKGYFVTSCVKE